MTAATMDSTKEFADAVRAALSDLPADEIDDLTDGLEADLAERAQDEDAPDFGDPVAYANELRSAAGLPSRSTPRPTTLDAALLAGWREVVDGVREVYSLPVVSRVGSFFVSLRPVWWLVRAIAFYFVLAWVFHLAPSELSPVTFVLGVGALIVSVQFGRGRWLPHRWMRRTLLAINILLVLTLPILLVSISNLVGSANSSAYAEAPSGLTSNGRVITNIFAYDASGKPLTQVQLFDQNGRPLYVEDPWNTTTPSAPYLVPYNGKQGTGGWNVYPLEYLSARQLDYNGNPKPHSTPTPSQLLDFQVHALKTPTPVPVGTTAPTPVPTGTATATPTPAPTAGH